MIDAQRRSLLAAFGASALLTLFPGTTRAATGHDTRFLLVLLRGGLDGLHMLPAFGDPAYAALRGDGAIADPIRIDSQFGLHPAMQQSAAMYREKQLLPIVAIAPPYRQRSHFEAQDCLENGTATPSGARDGWLGRCVGAMPGNSAIAIAAVMPLALRGSDRASNWSPPLSKKVDPLLLQQLGPLYAADARLSETFERSIHGATMMRDGKGAFALPEAMRVAAQRMSAADGPRIGFVEDSGWDTHRNQAALLQRKLAELDQGLANARDAFGAAWPRTVVAVVTEFGRTAAINGSGGTDHGTGGVALLCGGAVHGGRIGGDWPGLAPAQLNEGRDVRATSDLRGLFKRVLVEHVGLADSAIESKVFPGSRAVAAMQGVSLA
ncbi:MULTISPECIES: DUF1501 domain-containing protein [Lysobacter]|uniref:DUF1501 domain-containing protein n=2 Tax=Lysobacter gummosus TaxID=262324 RepID=A0ABY3X5R0_9GAMM|nr:MULTISPECIES: DUF1501 domain-containing protein [Lysobacter]ALN92297.1 hypothetical protein LG3211_3343 [Lysobacter gummosus]UJB20772.1 DUF1501 domain-containing protein [Lysobacter capsici]UJQ30114.1 DUF1501 domain-containing protein [Lysobacter gummosus]UNP27902.1 DUF1501 domain-containing protein [Lysobacter gummosus]